MGPQDTQAQVELRENEAGQWVMLAYSNHEQLVTSAGEAQPWIAVPADRLWQVQQDELTEYFNRGKIALEKFADELDTVRAKVKQAREVAGQAGLGLTPTAIEHPGPEPAKMPMNGARSGHDGAHPG